MRQDIRVVVAFVRARLDIVAVDADRWRAKEPLRDRRFCVWHIDAAYFGLGIGLADDALRELKCRLSVWAAGERQYLNEMRCHHRTTGCVLL